MATYEENVSLKLGLSEGESRGNNENYLRIWFKLGHCVRPSDGLSFLITWFCENWVHGKQEVVDSGPLSVSLEKEIWNLCEISISQIFFC